jgi:hypothetical protein
VFLGQFGDQHQRWAILEPARGLYNLRGRLFKSWDEPLFVDASYDGFG